ncbi:HAD family hydrolase [uncultured Bacteroides sp.]|uniref:HAD family hydrolase n=1 Tax=uncultured Bacteroides sp. TaxID=162156 RepID=UPI0026166DDD|nr:HAD family hydrolase [uncultured Bacteroides sp.]
MKKLAIFDLDGTLLDTIADLAASTNYALSACGYPTHETDAYRFFVGNGINKLFERALPKPERNEGNVLKIRSLFVPYYNIHNADLSRPYPGITEVLEKLQQNGIKLAVASNKYQEATYKLIKQYFPDIDFIEIFGQREGVPVKPDPSVIFEIMEKAGAGKEETIYIGDSCVDMQTGINAGVTTVGVSWGFRPRTELESYHPQYIADRTEELLDYIR